MSLQNLQLSRDTIARLYTAPLVDMNAERNISAAVKEDPQECRFLGSNKKNITILVNAGDASFLPDHSFHFLTGILNACKLTMEDVALVNINNLKDAGYTGIYKITRPAVSLLFDVSPNDIGLPLQFPHFQVHKYNSITYLSSPSLVSLENDKAAKAVLWSSLKTIFQL
ncbi:MAG: hypothetical protein J0H29_11930 [Sphingobacteriales bacterium]|nr:hypothetical protein [Sphingobacteriales bacterium]OJY84270.1 MAG: hypothetical protein BGP14_18620 [Sphingobacteriales bacterium 44-15]